ncbi:hypothetical protein AVEN_213403-1 [Araneus ventricosus]|uniref:Uncharacterized protein n=1 Tax=Araneus ventricosus TaxID=182803 RepID=A0A4Y2R176_ARAVE|nr:hypothetical protein AVEN_213403-1 [Araneus ventricosus]
MSLISSLFPLCRCLRSVGCGTYRKPAGEVPVCPGRVLPDTVPQPAHSLRQAAAPTSLSADGQLAGHRAALLREAGRQDPYRDAHPGHAAQREFLQLALYAAPVTHGWGTPRAHACPRPEMAYVHGSGPHAGPRRPQEVAQVGR